MHIDGRLQHKHLGLLLKEEPCVGEGACTARAISKEHCFRLTRSLICQSIHLAKWYYHGVVQHHKELCNNKPCKDMHGCNRRVAAKEVDSIKTEVMTAHVALGTDIFSRQTL